MTLLGVRREERLPLGDDCWLLFYIVFCFVFFLKKKRDFNCGESDSLLVRVNMRLEEARFCTHSFPGQSSPPLNSSFNVYCLPLMRESVHLFVCEWMETNVCFEKGAEFLVYFFLSFFFFYLIL